MDNFLEKMKSRRSCRKFSTKQVDLEIIKKCIQVAGTAPSGANTQPWFFSVVQSSEIKSKIRTLAEKEEFLFYTEKASIQFKKDLEPFGTDWKKPHLEDASVLIAVFCQLYNLDSDNNKKNCYYPQESTCIATGMLLTALHLAGLDTLTHTPSPMKFLNVLLNRPSYERPVMIICVGYKSVNYLAPDINKKTFNQISEFL
jgi:iodotyrosine deiodinase